MKKALRKASDFTKDYEYRFVTSPADAHKSRLWKPLTIALISVFLNPYLLHMAISTANRHAADSVLNAFCGLTVISGSLALAGYLIGSRYRSRNRIVKAGRYLAFFNGIFLMAMEYSRIAQWSMQLVNWLFTLIQNPFAYMTFILIFAFLAAVILPIPVELALVGYIVYLQNPNVSFLGLGIFGAFLLISILMGIGKALGAWVVFVIGIKVEKLVNRYLSWKWFQRLLRRVERFCVRFGYLAMFIVMSIPLMTDTVPLYIFSILNKDGEIFEQNWFVLTNLWAGIARTLVLGILVVAGVMSFGYVAG